MPTTVGPFQLSNVDFGNPCNEAEEIDTNPTVLDAVGLHPSRSVPDEITASTRTPHASFQTVSVVSHIQHALSVRNCLTEPYWRLAPRDLDMMAAKTRLSEAGGSSDCGRSAHCL